MAEAIKMPLLSDTMTEGKIVAWHKKVGDKVKSDDVIAEVETDKATMEVMPYVDGTLLYIGTPEGTAAKVNGIIAIIGKEGENIDALINESKQEAAAPTPSTPEKQQPAPAATPSPEKQPIPQQQPSQPKQPPLQEAPKPAPAPQQIKTYQPVASVTAEDERLKASPLAKKLARDKGVDITQIPGSGDNGRIIRRDVESFKPAAAPKQQKKPAIPEIQLTNTGEEGYTDIPNSQIRSIIARKLTESKNGAPHFYLTMTMTMDNAMADRKAINDLSPVKISINDLVIKACAMSLRRHPQVNSSWMGDFIRQNHHIHIGTAVAVDEGLIVPVIKFADLKPLSQIAGEAAALIEKARTKKITPNEFTGNTFTISNLGMMDIDEFTAIINPPDACILAVGRITPTPVVENGLVVVRNLMKVTLSCDHRVVDGAVGAKFLQTLKMHLENPVTMFV
jgi:pyruvate dehydrogenase E2 component (dihydrolipoamide acetyltransferase)